MILLWTPEEERPRTDERSLLLSEAWLSKLEDLINANTEYADAAKTWEWDTIFR